VGEHTVVNEGNTRAAPPDVVDRLLWRDAQVILARHRAAQQPRHSASATAVPTCATCGHAFPCPPRRLAERAQNAALGSWNEAWTARHDLHSMRAVPGWRVDVPARVATSGTRNPGSFASHNPGRLTGAPHASAHLTAEDPPTFHPR